MSAVPLHLWLPLTLLVIVFLGFVSFAAIAVIPLLKHRKVHLYAMQLLIALAAAALLADVALQLIPYAFGERDDALEEYYHQYIAPFKSRALIALGLRVLPTTGATAEFATTSSSSTDGEESQATGTVLGFLFILGYFLFLTLDHATSWFVTRLSHRIQRWIRSRRKAKAEALTITTLDGLDEDRRNTTTQSSTSELEIGMDSTLPEDVVPPSQLDLLAQCREEAGDTMDDSAASDCSQTNVIAMEVAVDIDSEDSDDDVEDRQPISDSKEDSMAADGAIDGVEVELDDDTDENKQLRHRLALLSLLGDLVHNVFDGVALATAFASSLTLGISTTIAVVLHEIPQEISDIAMLHAAGMSLPLIALLNVAVSGSGILGVALFLVLQEISPTADLWLLPIVAGTFVYLAATMCIPLLLELNGRVEGNTHVGALMQGIGYVIGVGILLFVSTLG
jgi:zinc transporter ZupT